MWTKANPNTKMLISYSGNFPEKLYRYRTVSPANLDRLINFEIIEEAIYLAGLKDLNDPDEGRFLIKFEGSRTEIMEYWRESLKSSRPILSIAEIENEAESRTEELIRLRYVVPEHTLRFTRYVLEHVLRVACFTTQPVNYSMWANYAKYVHPTDGPIGHGDVCLEYYCDEAWRSGNLHPVEYSDAVPEINVIKRDENELVKAIYLKSTEWRCEEEWRIMSIIQSMPPFPDNLTANSKIKLKNGIASVIFGLNTPRALIEKIQAKVSAAKPKISFRQVVRDPKTFNRKLCDLK